MHPVRFGFRAVFRQPALILAEIAWRWSFGAAAWVLVVLSIRRILAGIDITEAEYLLARRSDVFLIADACARILYQALPAFIRAAFIIIPALAVIWILAATLGRAATLKALLSLPVILSEDAPVGASESKAPYADRSYSPAGTHFGQLAFLHVIRALFSVATLLAFIGTVILAGIAFPAQGANPTAAAVIWVVLAAVAAFFWSVINWFLALAPIWIVRDSRGPFRAIADSLALFRRDSGTYVSAAWWFGFLRTVTLVGAFIAGLFAAAALESARAVTAVSLLIALIYFALADFLYIARLAAFINFDQSSHFSVSSSQPFAPEPQPLTSPEA